ncbi:MAG: Amuc_1100 family pilus-like protein [Lentisphaeria bacterium]
MSFIKRNIGIVIFGLLALIAAVVMLVFLGRYMGRAADFEAKVEEQQSFLKTLKTREIPVNQANLDALSENYALTREKLQQIKTALWEKSHISVDPVRDIEAKRILSRFVREMQRDLQAEGVIVEKEAENFSFQSILEAEGLPDEKTEVPVIMKQLEIVRDIIRLTGAAKVDRLLSLQRPMGLNSAERVFFKVMPFDLLVEGRPKQVKKLITSLQSDANYLFSVQAFEVVSGNEAGALLQEGIGAAWKEQKAAEERENRESRRRGELDGRIKAEVEEETLPKEARLVGLKNVIRVKVRVDFLEFNKPEQE